MKKFLSVIALMSLLSVCSSSGQAQQVDSQESETARPKVYVFLTTAGTDTKKPEAILYAVDPDQPSATVVYDDLDPYGGRHARVSPDGKSLAYAECYEIPIYDGDPPRIRFHRILPKSVFLRPIGGDDLPQPLGDLAGHPVWSRDGKQLLLIACDAGDATETFHVGLDGISKGKLPIPSTERVQDISSDGQWCLTVSTRHRADVIGNHLYWIRLDGTEERRLTDRGSNNVSARLSPDGKSIAYVRVEKDVTELCVMELETGERKVVYRERDGVTPGTICWSPDGLRLAAQMVTWNRDGAGRRYMKENGHPYLVTFDLDGTQSEPLPLPPAWTLSVLDWR